MSNRIDKEKRIIKLMIRLYCKKAEGNQELCPDCQELLDYAWKRLDNCPYGEEKRACERCRIHCYHSGMRERIRQVMRYSGPRMLLYAPWEVLRHYLKQ